MKFMIKSFFDDGKRLCMTVHLVNTSAYVTVALPVDKVITKADLISAVEQRVKDADEFHTNTALLRGYVRGHRLVDTDSGEVISLPGPEKKEPDTN